jgi:hypothetical protein
MVGPTMFDAELRELGRQFEAAVAEYDAVSERLGVAVEPVLHMHPIGIGGSLTTPPLPHHRTYGSVYGGSAD